MSMLAAQKYGADVTSYGLVPSQNDGMRMLMRSRNFSGKLALVEKDHRELANEPSRYDRFVSIGVHEHAGRDCNEQWIRSIATGLRPGGVGLISATFNMKKRPTNYCTIKHIFPGGPLPHLLLRYTQALIGQTGQMAVCNRHHSLEQQFCRWILSCLDRLPSNELTMTQEVISDMLGVRREGVTEAAGRLQKGGTDPLQPRPHSRTRSLPAGSTGMRMLCGRQRGVCSSDPEHRQAEAASQGRIHLTRFSRSDCDNPPGKHSGSGAGPAPHLLNCDRSRLRVNAR
jgi:hypothetical protein